ncbi:MAG: protein kinase domain-containing protein [Prochlorotrichaceae cyanobacterium]
MALKDLGASPLLNLVHKLAGGFSRSKVAEPAQKNLPEELSNILHQQIASMTGTENFKVLSHYIQQEPFRLHGQFVVLDKDGNVICDYEMNSKRLTYRMSEDQSKAAYYLQKYGKQTGTAPVARPMEDLVPGVVLGGKYRIESKLGEGGFGATFIVSDESKKIRNTYVAKLQKLTGDPAEDQGLIERFEREATALQQVGSSHGQVPTLFDYFDEQGNFFLIQEQVKGPSLQSVFLEGARQGHLMSNAYAMKLTMEILEVVQYIHNQGIIHRDIKPDNIILRAGDDKPVLIDFGLIKQTKTGVELKTGTMAGTPGYMPLEQQMGKALFQSDLFAVGMVFLLFTTGRPPHSLEPDFNTMSFELSWAEDYLPQPLLEWVKVATGLRPQDRFGSATEMRQALIDIRDHALRVEGFEKAWEILQDGSEISDSDKRGRSTHVDLDAIQTTGSFQSLPSQLGEIITTQKELDAFNALKRVLERAGRDGQLLEMHDQPDFCDIHYRGHQDQLIVRLYFNDEDNLAFAVVNGDGTENRYAISTLRGISPKSPEVIARLEAVETALGITQGSAPKKPDDEYVPENDEDLVIQEFRPAIVQQLTQMYGPDFELLSLHVEDEPFRIYGQFSGKDHTANLVFDYEVKHNAQGQLGMSYRMNPDCLAQQQAAEKAQKQKEDELAQQGVYTVEWLQRNFDSFSEAKDHFGIRAKSWQKLADALAAQKQG